MYVYSRVNRLNPCFILLVFHGMSASLAQDVNLDSTKIEKASGPKSYRITHESEDRDALEAESDIDTFLRQLGDKESDAPILNSVGQSTGAFVVALRCRRMAKLVEALDSIAPSEAESLIRTYAKRNQKTVELHTLEEVGGSIEVNSLPFDQRSDRIQELYGYRGTMNWRVANYCSVILVGRYAPNALLDYESEIIKAIRPATDKATNVPQPELREELLSQIYRKAYPKLLWINVYRLALSRKGILVPDDEIHRPLVQDVTMYKWSAVPALPEVGSTDFGRKYSEADVLETFAVIPTWWIASQNVTEDAYLEKLRDAIREN